MPPNKLINYYLKTKNLLEQCRHVSNPSSSLTSPTINKCLRIKLKKIPNAIWQHITHCCGLSASETRTTLLLFFSFFIYIIYRSTITCIGVGLSISSTSDCPSDLFDISATSDHGPDHTRTPQRQPRPLMSWSGVWLETGLWHTCTQPF